MAGQDVRICGGIFRMQVPQSGCAVGTGGPDPTAIRSKMHFNYGICVPL